MRIISRKFAKNIPSISILEGTHLIKIGASSPKTKDGKEFDLPIKLNGFIIYYNRLDNNNKFIIDYEAMQKLGFSKENIIEAMKGGFNAPSNLLPQELHFILIGDAIQSEKDNSWDYPGIYNESYECYNKEGLFCSGDGKNAIRKMEDGTKKYIPCNPFGKFGVDPKSFCEFSGVDKPCKAHLKLSVCLIYKENNIYKPLIPGLGMQAKYIFQSSSEYIAQNILEELDRASNRLKGQINGITGSLSFQKRARRTGKSLGISKAITGYVFFQLHEEAIRAKEKSLWGDKYFPIPPINEIKKIPDYSKLEDEEPLPQKADENGKNEAMAEVEEAAAKEEEKEEKEIEENIEENIEEKIEENNEENHEEPKLDIDIFINGLKDDETKIILNQKIKELSKKTGVPESEILKKYTIQKNGKFLTDINNLFKHKSTNPAHHQKCMKFLRDTLKKIILEEEI